MDEIRLTGVRSRAESPHQQRRIVARVEVDGVERGMVFLTNNLAGAAGTAAELFGPGGCGGDPCLSRSRASSPAETTPRLTKHVE